MADYEILLRFGTYIGTFTLLLGVIYRYIIKRHEWILGKALTLVVYSYFSGGGLVLIFKGLDYLFCNSRCLSSILGELNDAESMALVAIGSLSGLAFVVTFAFEFIRDTRKKPKTVRKKKRANKEYDGLIKQLQEEQYGMQKLFDETTQLLKKLCPNEKNHLNIWGRINIYDNFRNRRFDDNLFDEIEAFLMFIEKANQRKEQNHSIQEAKVYRALIDLLEDYRDTNIELPGINKTISEFIYDLKKSADKCEPERVFLANSDRARELLLQLKENRARITTEIFRKIRDIESDLSDDSGYNPEEDSKLKEISRLSDELGAIEKKVGEFEVKYAQIGKPDPSGICELGKGPLQDYVSYTEQQLLDFISDLKEDLRTKTGRFNNTITKIKLHEKLIKGLEGKEQHKYQDNLDGLNKLLEVCDSLLRKFRKKYTDYISDIIDHNVITGKVDADQLKYNNAVSDYLGKRVGFLRHLDTEHKLEKIDLVAGLAITDKGKKIKLEDMGTGQSQSAYLLGKLNTSDNRKIIALFDEVAMMDTKSLAPIYKRFEELYNENRLIVGIVVQKADKTCIKPLVKGHKK